MMHLYPTLLWDDIIPYERRRIKKIRLRASHWWTSGVTGWTWHLTEVVYRGTTSPLACVAALTTWPSIPNCLAMWELISGGCSLPEDHESFWCLRVTNHLDASQTILNTHEPRMYYQKQMHGCHMKLSLGNLISNMISDQIKCVIWSSSFVAIRIHASFVNVTSKCNTFTIICDFQGDMTVWSTMWLFRIFQHLFWYGEWVSNMVATYSVSFESVAWCSNMVTNTRPPSNQWFLICHWYTRPFQHCGWFWKMVSTYYSALPLRMCWNMLTLITMLQNLSRLMCHSQWSLPTVKIRTHKENENENNDKKRDIKVYYKTTTNVWKRWLW